MTDMEPRHNATRRREVSLRERLLAVILILCFMIPPFQTPATAKPQAPQEAEEVPSDSTVIDNAELLVRTPLLLVEEEEADTTKTVVVDPDSPYGLDGKKIFNPDPTRAVWLSALFPGLGQIYNRRYWKLPIVVGGFMGLAYATNWNNNQYQDYSRGFRDLLDTDPNTKSYMDFFPPTTQESELDKAWLQSVMRSRKNFYRRNRDLCIICCVGLYLICMLDAYVDAQMSHFDISPDVSMDVTPAMLVNPGDRKVSLGLNWALTF